MPTHYGTFTCGHEGKIYLKGSHKNTEWLANKKFETMLCQECYEKKVSEEREKANREAAIAAKDHGFPELEGSVGQVPWATTIRQQMYDKFKNDMKDFQTDPKNIIRTI